MDEGDNVGGVMFPLCVPVSPLGRVAEEGGVANLVLLLPVPITGVPFELGDKTGLKNPVDRGFFPVGGKPLANLSVAPWPSCSRILTGLYPSRGIMTSCELVAWMRPVLEYFLYSLAPTVS